MATITATDDEMVGAACRAIAASSPVGMGFLHFNPADDQPNRDEVKKHLRGSGIYIDYFNGRMVKFGARRGAAPDTWEVHDEIDPEYQSWCVRYPSYQALLAK